jgi:hypothetical protein
MNFPNEFLAITEASDRSFIYSRLAISTFIRHNHWFDGTVVVLTLKNNSLSDQNLKTLRLIYSKIEVLKIDDSELSNIKNRLSKKGWDPETLLDYLYLMAFKIKSSGSLYFSRNIVFQNEISNILDSDRLTLPIASSKFPDLDTGSDRAIDYSLMWIPSKIIEMNLKSPIEKELLNINVFDFNSRSKSIINIVSEDNINRVTNQYLVTSSAFNNSRYTEFIRYHKGIYSIRMNTLAGDLNNYNRIHTYWNHLNKSEIDRASQVKSLKDIGKLVNRTINKNKDNKIIDRNINLEHLSINEVTKSKIALCTICNDDFIKGAQVMIHSFLKQNDWFNGDIIVMYSKKLSPLSIKSKRLLRQIDPNIIFKEIDETSYSAAINRFVNRSGVHLKFMPSLFTFEVFAIEEYDTIMYVDSDILHINPMIDMFRISGDFVVTPASLSHPTRFHHSFSGGVFMIRGNMISKSIKDELLKFSITTSRYSLLDQTIMNDYFANKEKIWASNDFNCSKRCYNDSNFLNFNRNSISLVHYVSEKPWNDKINPNEDNYKKLEALWTTYYKSNILKYSKNEDKIKVAVIGNSPNIVNHKIGKLIDEFDVVIRVNDFRTIGFEENVGTKTDYVITTFATNFKTKEFDSISPKKVFMSLFDKKNQMEFLKKRIERFDLKSINTLPDQYYLELNKKVDLIGVNKRCSSGTIAIEWAINNYPEAEIYIHGIDLIKSKAHYFDQSIEKINSWKKSIEIYHDFNKEKKYIKNLMKLGLIKKII